MIITKENIQDLVIDMTFEEIENYKHLLPSKNAEDFKEEGYKKDDVIVDGDFKHYILK